MILLKIDAYFDADITEYCYEFDVNQGKTVVKLLLNLGWVVCCGNFRYFLDVQKRCHHIRLFHIENMLAANVA